MSRAFITGISGVALSSDERCFLADTDPLGFILFGRNIREPAQVSDLVADLRDLVGRGDAPVLIDQEGGRVQRLSPPHWRNSPPASAFARLAEIDIAKAEQATRINARMIGRDLAELGISVDCAPVLDIPARGADPIIGDRAFGTEPAVVTRLGAAFCNGLLDAGVRPVLKHIPGHGRAGVDSHKGLPIVETSLAELDGQDFQPFRSLCRDFGTDVWAMTAHIVYTSADRRNPATLSPQVIESIIRRSIGFDGLLVSDDLSMQALSGGIEARARNALAAGCDVVLHCNGDLAEMRAVAAGSRDLVPDARTGLARAIKSPEPRDIPDRDADRMLLDGLMAGLPLGNAV